MGYWVKFLSNMPIVLYILLRKGICFLIKEVQETVSVTQAAAICGVGRTTVSASLALVLARTQRRVLLCEIGDSDTLKEYDYTSALGYPSESVQSERDGMKGALLQTYGFILGIHPQALPGFSFIYNTTPFQPGFSGGPLVDKDNKVRRRDVKTGMVSDSGIAIVSR